MSKKSLLFILGTRPEAIKLAPLIKKCHASDFWDVRVCVTGQHRQLLDTVLSFFEITPDFDLDVMSTNQSLVHLTQKCLLELDPVITSASPDMVVIQGDTTTAYTGALNAFYHKIPVAHVEAGLRSFNRYSPFPEELNREMITKLSNFHFCPSKTAYNNLISEDVREHVYTTGNTVIDALFWGIDRISKEPSFIKDSIRSLVKSCQNYSLVTCHRRESFGQPFESIVNGLKRLAADYQGDMQFIFPVHPNPYVINTTKKYLSDCKNIHLIPAVDYPNMLYLLQHCHLVLTDSGGLQEEAPSLHKPVLILRNVTERVEGIEAGTSILVGTQEDIIYEKTRQIIEDPKLYQSFLKAQNPYGDGKASDKIVEVFYDYFRSESRSPLLYK